MIKSFQHPMKNIKKLHQKKNKEQNKTIYIYLKKNTANKKIYFFFQAMQINLDSIKLYNNQITL